MLLRGFNGKSYRLGKEFDRGGEGLIYEVVGDKSLVGKTYFDDKRTPDRRAKIEAMVAARIHEQSTQIAFPVDGLLDSHGSFIGFVMNRIDKACEIHQLYDRIDRAQLFPESGVQHLVRTATNLARVFETLHGANCVIGDINERNILVREDCTVRLIDSDSMQFIHGGTTHACPVATPFYRPPEIAGLSARQIGKREPNQDCFGLAIFIFKLLMDAAHPFDGPWHGSGPFPDTPTRISRHLYAYSSNAVTLGVAPQAGNVDIGWLGRDIRMGFESAFGPHGRTARPTATQWVALLRNFESSLVNCRSSDYHNYDPSVSSACPWCALEKTTRSPIFGPDVLRSRRPTPPPPPPPTSPPPLGGRTVTPAKKPEEGIAPWVWALGGIAALALLGLITSNNNGEQATATPPPSYTYTPTPQAVVPPVTTYQTSYDCRRANTWAEQQVCANQQLANRDVELAATYNRLLRELPYSRRDIVRDTQRGFLGTRDQCNAVDCIERAYENQLSFLTTYSTPPPPTSAPTPNSRPTSRRTSAPVDNRHDSDRNGEAAPGNAVLCTVPGRRGAPPQDLYLAPEDCASRAGLIN